LYRPMATRYALTVLVYLRTLHYTITVHYH